MKPSQTQYNLHLSRGKRFLAKHKPEDALKHFKRAIEICAVEKTSCLSTILYYTGITLKRLGLDNSALKSWLASVKIRKSGYSAKMLTRFANHYGMARQNNDEDDDCAAFYSVQLARYIQSKKGRDPVGSAEKDMIKELIQDYWLGLKRSGMLEGKSPEEKMRIFKKISIVFPYYIIPEEENSTIFVNFNEKRRMDLGDRCFCGSGLPYLTCCGRTPGADELLYGEL